MDNPLPPFLPLVVEGVTLVGWDGYSYVATSGRTYWSGEEPTEADAIDAVTTPREVPISNEAQAVIYAGMQADGYLDGPLNIRLKTTNIAWNRFTSMVSGIELSLRKGVLTEAESVEIFDFDNQPNEVTVADFLALMIRYFAFCKQLHAEHAP